MMNTINFNYKLIKKIIIFFLKKNGNKLRKRNHDIKFRTFKKAKKTDLASKRCLTGLNMN